LNAPEAFAEPWQAQAFAIVVALSERGLFSWAAWTQALGAEIARAPQRPYYESWLQALENILEEKGAARPGALKALAQAWLDAAEATPHGQPIVLGRIDRFQA
jgi:nitrile hydratase accessory protein